MNITIAEAVIKLHDELICHLETLVIAPPEPTFRKEYPYSRQGIFIEDGRVKIEWSRYEGCGSYENETSYHNIDDLITD